MGGEARRDCLEKPVLFRAINKYSCRSQGRAVSDPLVDTDETIAIKNLGTRVCVPGVTNSGRGSKRREGLKAQHEVSLASPPSSFCFAEG